LKQSLEALKIKKVYSVLQDFLIFNADLSCLFCGAIAELNPLLDLRDRTAKAQFGSEATI